MGRNDERDAVVELRQDPAEMAVPSVTMDEIGVDVRGIEIDVTLQRAENRLQRLWTSKFTRIKLISLDLESAFFEILIAEATNIDIDGFRQLAREIANVHTGTAVNVRRIFVGQKEDFHASKWPQSRVRRAA